MRRIAKENRVFAGIWYGAMKPDMSLLLKPLALSLKKLFIEGTYCLYPSKLKSLTYHGLGIHTMFTVLYL